MHFVMQNIINNMTIFLIQRSSYITRIHIIIIYTIIDPDPDLNSNFHRSHIKNTQLTQTTSDSIFESVITYVHSEIERDPQDVIDNSNDNIKNMHIRAGITIL